MQLFPDLTIFVQVAFFVVFWMAFKVFVYGPTNEVLEMRHQRMVDAARDAEQLAAAAAADRASYDQRLLDERHSMAQEAEAARHAAIAASNDEIAAARANITRDLAHRRQAIASQVADARRALAAEADQLASDMLQRVSRGGHA